MAEAGKLIFGVAIGDTKALITSQLAGIINGLPTYKIKAKLDLTKGDTEKAVRSVLSSLQKDKSMKLTISNATLSNSARSNLKAEINQLMKESGLQKAIDSSVKKNMKNLYGASGVSTKQISKRQQDHLSYLKGMEDYSKKLQSTWASVRNKNMALPADSKELKNVTSSYNEMCKAVGRYKALVGEGKAKYDDRMAAQKAVDNFDKEIRNYTAYAEERKQAAAAAAEAEKSASRAAAEEAKKNANATLQQVQSLYKQIENFERRNPKAMRNSEYANFVNKSKQELSDAVSKSKDGIAGISEGRINEIKNGLSSIRMEADRLGVSGQTVGDRIKAMYQKFGGWSLVVQSMRHAWFTMKDMFNQVKEIDTAMTELKKVTNEDDATYTKFLTNAASRAKDVGATISDTVTATADFARLGYSLSDASQLADAALIYKNVGDGIEDVSTASQSIISTMKAFGIQASDSMHIVDAFNEVGNNFAISSAGIGEAMQRSASALAEGNNTFEESIGLITAMNSTVQDTQKVGTALKTVSMYLRATKTDAEDAGESTDGMASSVSKLRDDIYALTNGGVDIMLDPNTYKSTYQIMKDLSGVWDSLTDITRANILEKIGGKRNANVVSSLLENFDVAESAMQKAMNSTGSAVKENEKYLDSIQGKIQKFKVAFQSLSQTLMSSSMLKDFISLGTGILNIIDKIVGKVGGLKGVASVIGGIVIKKNWDAIGTSLSRMSMYFNQIQWLVGNLGVKGTLNTVGVDGSFIKGLVGTPSFIGATVAGLTILTSQISKLYESAQKSREETISKGKSTFKDIFDIDDQASLVSKYNEYLKVNQAYIDNAASKQELEEATSSLTASLGLESASLPSLAEQYGSVSNALAKYTQEKMKSASVDLVAANAAAKEHVEAEEATKNGGQTMGQRIYGAMSYANKEHNIDLDRYIEKIDGVTVAHGHLGKSSITLNSQLDTSVEGLRKQLSTLDEIVGVYDKALERGEITSNELANDSQYTAVISRQKELKEGLEDYLTSISNNNTAMAQVMLLDELNSKVPRTVSDFEKLRSRMYGAAESGGMFLGTTEDIHDAIDGVLKESPQLSKFSKYLTDDVFEYTNSKKSSKMVGKMEQLGEQMIEAQRRGATKKYSSLKAEYEDVFESFAEMAAGSGKSLDEYLSDFRPTVKSFARDLDIDLDKALGNHNSTVIKTGEAYEKAAAAMKKAGKDGELAIDGVAGKEDTMMGSGEKMWDSVDYSLKNISILKEAFDDALSGETDTFAIDYAIDKFPELADRTDDLSLAIQELINSESAGISSNFNDIIASLGEDADPTVLRELQQALLDYVNTSYLIPDIDIDVESEGIESFTEAIAEANSETGLLSESINNLNNRYSSLSSFDQSKLYEKTASGVRLNMQELNRLERAYAQNNILQERTKLAALEGEYERLTAAIGGATNAETKRDLYTRRNNVIDEIKNAQMLIAEYDGLTNALNRYKNVKDQGNLRDNRDFIKDELSELAELRKSGYVGENQFREGVNLMTYADAATMSVDELVKAYDSGIAKMKRYFDESGKGWKNFLSDIQAVNKAWARKDSEGNWLLDFDVDDVAKQMNLSTATVQTLVDDLEARGFKISIKTEYSSLSDLVLEASQAEAALNELEGVDITFDFSSNDVKDLNSQLSSAKQLLDEMKKDPFTFDASSIKDAETAVAALAMQKSNLEGYSIMHIELSDEHINTKLGEAISLAQQFQKQSGLLEIAVALNKTEDIESIGNSLSEILNTVQKDPDLSKVMMDLGIRTDSKEHFANDLKKIGEDEEVLLKAGLDESEIKNIKPEIKSKVNFDVSGAKSAAEKSQSYFDSVVKQEVTFEIDISQWPDKLKEWLGADGDTITMTVKAETKTESAVQDQNTGEWSYKSETKKVIIDPDDRKLSAVEKRLDDFEKEPKKVTIDANDNASKTLDSVEGKSNAVDGSDPTVDVNAKDNASGTLNNVNAQADNFANKNVSPTIGVKDAASGILSKIASLINSIHDKSVTISVTQSLRYTSGSSRTSGGIGGSYNGGRLAIASGTAFSHGSWGTNGSGTALVGELGREIVVRDGKWFTVGDNGAEFFRYKTNDIIFNARQSESLLKYGGIKGISPRGSAFLSGTAFGPGSNVSGAGKDYSSAGSSSSKKSSSSSSKASSAAKSAADSEKSEFEKAYAYHQHLLKMEQEDEATYLAWLEQAYKDAYAQQKIELDDYYKYEEECYEKRKSIFQDHLTDQEHQIWLYTDTMEGMEMAGVAVYEQMLKEIASESNAARARGLDETDSYVQELQKKWRDYYNKAEELRQKPYNDSLNLQQKQLDYETKLRQQNTTKQVNIYKNMIATCEAAMRAGQARGLSETNEFMMQMAANVQEYANQIASTLQNAFSNFSGVISTVTSALSNFPQMSGTIQSLYNLDYSKSRNLLDYMTGAGSQYFSDTDRANQFAGALTKYFTAQDYQKQLKKNFNDALNGLIDKRASAIKESNQQARDAQADSLQDQLDALEEFYDKQIEMLQDEADYEDYLKNQKEKRKSIADIEAALAQLEADDSAAANKKKLKLRQELADKTADLDEFERDHARDTVIKQLEDERDEKTKALQDQLDAVRSYSESEVEIRQQATNDIMNMNEQQFSAFIQGLIDSGQMTEDEAKEMIENFLRVADAIGYATEQLKWYQWAVDFSGYSGMDETAQYLANGATEYANKVGSNTGTPGDYDGKNQVVSTAKKSAALSAATTGYKEANDDWWNMKQTAGYKSGADKKWIDTKYQTEEDVSNALKAYASSASYTDDGATALLDRYINGGNAYEANKAKELKRLAGLATGTSNASPGIYRFDEKGTEYYLSKDGNKYKMMSAGDKMLNAKATDFLYNFAIGKNSAIQELIERMSGANIGAGVESKVVAPIINMGDINVAGDASERTVSEIRRAQRDQMNFIIKEFNKYSR